MLDYSQRGACQTERSFSIFLVILQLKTQLSETLSKLKIDQNERQKLAGDLPKVSEACWLVIDSNTIKCSGGLLG